LSVTLDLARASAAFYVLVQHLVNARLAPADPPILMRFGQEAVLCFFLLSGFVIFANERTRALNPWPYYWRRLRRIYPPLLLAMAVSTCIMLAQGELKALFDVRQFVATLLSLQDISRLKPGVVADPYLLNDPLWSLSYEAAFYLIFPPLLMAWTRFPARTEHAIGLGCCLLFVLYVIVPGHFQLVGAYFLLWWCGAMAAKTWQDGGTSVLALRHNYLWLLALCALAAIAVAMKGNHGLGYYPVLQLRHFGVGALLLALFYGPLGRLFARSTEWLGPVAKWFAGISYGVYVLHFPLLVQWRYSLTVPGTVIALLLVFALSYAVERGLPRLLLKPRPRPLATVP